MGGLRPPTYLGAVGGFSEGFWRVWGRVAGRVFGRFLEGFSGVPGIPEPSGSAIYNFTLVQQASSMSLIVPVAVPFRPGGAGRLKVQSRSGTTVALIEFIAPILMTRRRTLIATKV